MQITTILPIFQTRNPPRQRRAVMSVRFDKHTVTDTETGESFALPATEAWELFEKLNRGITC